MTQATFDFGAPAQQAERRDIHTVPDAGITHVIPAHKAVYVCPTVREAKRLHGARIRQRGEV